MTHARPLSSPLRSNSGFSLVMALIAVAILVAISLAIAALMNSITAQTRHMNSVAGSRALVSTLQGFMSYPTLCTANLDASTRTFYLSQATSADGLPLSFQLGSTTEKVEAGRELRNYDVVTQYLSFHSSATPIAADPMIAGNQLYSGFLVLKLLKRGEGAVAGGNTMHEIGVGTLILSVTPANYISRCYALADARQACEEAGGVYNDLTTPRCKLSYPCEGVPDSIFMGYDAGVPRCKTAAQIVGESCPSGQYLVSNGGGGATCQSP